MTSVHKLFIQQHLSGSRIWLNNKAMRVLNLWRNTDTHTHTQEIEK